MAVDIKKWSLFNSNLTGTGTPLRLYPNRAGSQIVMQVYSELGVSFNGTIEVKVFNEANWSQVSIMNHDGRTTTSTITLDGIYEFTSYGYVEVRFNVTALSGGNLTAKVKVI